MLYEIVLLACLIADPADCGTTGRTISATVAPNFIDAQVWCAQWAGEHPRWMVKRCELLPGRSA